jgi:hypothetical protein
MNLEKAVVHEPHETVLAGNPQSGCSQKTRTDSNTYRYQHYHPIGDSLILCNLLIFLVTFVILRVVGFCQQPCENRCVDEKRFLG